MTQLKLGRPFGDAPLELRVQLPEAPLSGTFPVESRSTGIGRTLVHEQDRTTPPPVGPAFTVMVTWHTIALPRWLPGSTGRTVSRRGGRSDDGDVAPWVSRSFTPFLKRTRSYWPCPDTRLPCALSAEPGGRPRAGRRALERLADGRRRVRKPLKTDGRRSRAVAYGPRDAATRGVERSPRRRPAAAAGSFHSSRSGPSRRVEGFLAQVLQRRGNHRTFRLVRVAAEERPDLVARFGIEAVPTLVVVDGKR